MLTEAQTWGALRKAWKAYRIAQRQHDTEKMKEWSERIKQLQVGLSVPVSAFTVEESK